jgi:hypothetical protein
MFVIPTDDDFWATEEQASVPCTRAWIAKSDLMPLANEGEFDCWVSSQEFREFVSKLRAGYVMTAEEMWIYAEPAEDRIEVLFEGTSFNFQDGKVWAAFDGLVEWIVEPEYEYWEERFDWSDPDSLMNHYYTFTKLPVVRVRVF